MTDDTDPPSPLHTQQSAPHLSPFILSDPLSPPGSIYTDSTSPEPVPPPSSGKKVNFKRLWLLVTVSWIVIAALVPGLLFSVLHLLLSPVSNSKSHAPSTPSLLTSIPAPTMTPTTIIPLPIESLAIIPNHFNVTTDCQVDNGYRCTVTLIASQSLSGDISWYAYSTGITTKFNPASGILLPGQQQQVIIYIYNACPYSGSFIFSIKGNTMTIPLHCA